MSYLHGIYTEEVPTSVRPPIEANAGLPVVIGAAPVVLGDRTNVNKPVLCTSLADFNTQLGGIGEGDLADYSLSRFAQVYFGLYGCQPMVAINVLDPDDAGHVDAVPRAALAWTNGQTSQTVEVFAIDEDTVVLDDGALPPVAYTLATDYTLAYDDDGYLVITRVATGAMGTGALPDCHLTYSKLDPSGVDAADIVGTTAASGNTGSYCIEDVYPQLQVAPGMLLANGYSHESTVKAALVARGSSINDGAFAAPAIVDADPDSYEIADYSEVAAWKLSNGYTNSSLVVCWPLVTLGGEQYELSCHFAGLANLTDANQGGGTPYVSPSNRTLQIDGCCLEDGTEVFLTKAQANVLNGQGVVTALNWSGWKLWGNRTAGYPASSDPKDTFIPIRRMTLWLQNTLVLTFFSAVDSALNQRLIDSVVDSANIYLNGLKAQGAILGGECVFAEADNPTTDLLNGQVKFRIYWTPPPPAEAITFMIEYDAEAFSELFA